MMRKRTVVVVLAGFVAALFGFPAAPAFAAPLETCKNMPDLRFGGTLARTCIYTYDSPAGSAYTVTRVKIWNPAGYSNTIYANVYFNDGYSLHMTALADGGTWLNPNPTDHVGSATTRFQLANSWNDTYCMYMLPGTASMWTGPC
jgi:hypothetical protein